jgi:hypothetical protein
VGSAYLVFLAIFVAHLRRSRDRGGPPVPAASVRGPASLAGAVAATGLGGYAVFALVIVVFYLVLGDEPADFVPRSLAQGAVLAFGVVLPAFVLLGLAGSIRRRRR